ncbi:MAG TPA: metallophosphoesterase [Burkholderiales bacterium]|nr:metallophosphoesterase [Burkholderiales bacterium]
MTLLLQVSDTHFGTEQPPVVEALLRLVREQAPDLMVFSGDITQRARRRQFRAAKIFVDRISLPTIVLPGNHDIPLFNLIARIFYPYANHQRVFGSDLEQQFESADVVVIAVNTTRPARHKNGEVSAQQIERVAARLREAREEQLRIVVTHQPVHVTRVKEEKNLLLGREPAIREWARAGADLLLGGHIHLPYVRPLREEFKNLARDVYVVQAGTAVSKRIRHDAPNSINLIRYEHTDSPHRCVIERWDYEAIAREFKTVERSEIVLDRLFSPKSATPCI